MLNDKNYVDEMNLLIENFLSSLDEDSDYQLEWELLKLKIKDFTINYSKLKSTTRRNDLAKLYCKLNEVDKQLANDPQNLDLLQKRQKLTMDIKLQEDYKTHAAK